MSKVLIIEDTHTFAVLLQAQLRQDQGLESDVVASMAETQQRLAERAGDYYLAIVDLCLPDAPRGEVIDVVQQHGIPVMVFTSLLDDGLREDLNSRGVADYCLKQGQHNLQYVSKMAARLLHNAGIKVLVVDDSRSSRELLSHLLQLQRYHVITVDCAEAAFQALDQHPDIQIMLVDCWMPGMSGIELVAKVRETRAAEDLAIIGLSGQPGQAISAQFMKHGANDFLLKPFVPEELFCRVNQAADTLGLLSRLRKVNQQSKLILRMTAHDLRGPLGVIINAARRLLNKTALQPDQTLLVNLIQRGGEYLHELLEAILQLAQLEQEHLCLERTAVDMPATLQRVIEHQSPIAEAKQIRIVNHVSGECVLHAHSRFIRQVCENLLSNAIKFSPAGQQVEVSLRRNAKSVEIAFADHGAGIAEQDQPKLFKPFAKLANRPTAGETSTGLGLNICAKIVEAHDGQIGYRDNPGGGSVFYFTLPNA